MGTWTRRGVLTGSMAATLAALAGCGGSGSGSGSANQGRPQWWHDGQPQTDLGRRIVEEHKADLGEVDVVYQENTKLAQALQLAKQSDQMPDLTNIGGLGVPLSQLVEGGWFQPLALDEEGQQRLGEMGLVEGIHIFDGKTYSFPIQISGPSAVTWFRTDALAEADLDPESPPTTYDEFRDACRKVVAAGKTDGVMLPLKVTGTNGARAGFLAQSAGFAGQGGQLFATGEFAYHSDEWVNAIEFLKSLAVDKLMFPGSVTATVKDGQAKWAAGATAFFFDGPWIPGNIKLHYTEIKGKVGSGPILVPDKGQQPVVYSDPPGNSYFIPAGAKHPEVANKIMSIVASPEFQVMYAGVMAHLPLDREALAKSEAYDSFKQVCDGLYDIIFTAPTPVVGNLDVSKVDAVIKPAKPDIGTVIQGYFTGDVTDIRTALKQVSDSEQKALDDAIAAATAKGAQVSMDDWAFGNWQPRTDYTVEMYDQR